MRNSCVALALSSLLIGVACSKSTPIAPSRMSVAEPVTSVPDEVSVTAAVTTASVPAQTSTFPIQWTLTRASCPALWTDSITGSGTSHLKVRIVPAPGGVFQISLAEAGSGTAVDSNGVRYRFSSSNTFDLLAGPPFQLDVTEKFNLVGPGGKAYRVHAGYVSLFKVDASGNLLLDEFRARGDVSCIPS